MSLRIISGEKRGIPLATPKGDHTRPTLARVRESLFMVLDPWIYNARILDAFAGSGALGLEALSRGAREAVFFENHRDAQAALRQNIEKLKLGNSTQVVTRDATRLFRKPNEGAPFDLLLLDPPYHKDIAAKALEAMAANAASWLAPEGLLAAQVACNDTMPESQPPFRQTRRMDYNQTSIYLYERDDDCC